MPTVACVCAKELKVKHCLLQTWESKAKHASNDKETAQKQVSELQERLDAQGSSAQQSSQAIRAIEQRTAALQRQMRVKVYTAQCLAWLVCFISAASTLLPFHTWCLSLHQELYIMLDMRLITIHKLSCYPAIKQDIQRNACLSIPHGHALGYYQHLCSVKNPTR